MSLTDVRGAVEKARERNPGMKDVPLVLLDLFRRHAEDIPLSLGAGQIVGSPLKLMATRDLRAYVRRETRGFGGPPPKVVHLSKEEQRLRCEETTALFIKLGVSPPLQPESDKRQKQDRTRPPIDK